MKGKTSQWEGLEQFKNLDDQQVFSRKVEVIHKQPPGVTLAVQDLEAVPPHKFVLTPQIRLSDPFRKFWHFFEGIYM